MNPYNYFTSVVVNLQIGNIGTLFTHNKTLQEWTGSNATLTNSWTSSTNQTLETALNNVVGDADTPSGSQITMADFIKTYMGSAYLYDMSNQFMTQVMHKLGELKNNGSDTATQMSFLSTWNGVITSKGQLEEQFGQTEAKTEASVIEQDANAQQTFANMGSHIGEAWQTFANLLQQSF